MSQEEKCTESSQIILQWINGTESFLLSDDIKLTDLSVMKQQQQKLEEFMKLQHLMRKILEKIDISAQRINPEIPSSEELKGRYAEVKALLEERTQHCDIMYEFF